ncbi:MAG: Ldh family oxidoreductase [Rhizobiaceae bacterium]
MSGQAEMETQSPRRFPVERVRDLLASLFAAAGLSAAAARTMGEALVEADVEGLPSHGVMQAEVYLARLKAGSVIPAETAELLVDRDAMAVLDSHHMLGHLAGNQAMALAVDKAKRFGIGIVAVRHAFHFGPAGRYVRQAAEQDCVGIAMCNSRPSMPAPGGAQRLVGTNPLAIAVPTPDEQPPMILDMATSAGTSGRVRMAGKAGKPLPDGWAVTAEGEPTNDPAEALKGMLLPMGGAKGFGLSLMIDTLCGLLSSGAWGDAVPGLHGDLTKPFDTSHLFMAIHVGHFRPVEEFLAESGRVVERVHGSKKAPGTGRLYVPGERKWEIARANDGTIKLEAAQVAALRRLAGELGVDAGALA